jgi:hypothetical protein
MGTINLEVQKAGLARAILGEDDEAVINKLWAVFNQSKNATHRPKRAAGTLFAETFGMWAGRDVDVKQIRQQTRRRRTTEYGDGTV